MEHPVSPVELNTGSQVEAVAVETKQTPPPTEEDLLRKTNEIGEQLRALIVLCKRLPRDKALEPHQDPGRALSLAQMYLQTGFSWLRKAIQATKEF